MTKKNPDEISICLNCYRIKFKPRNRPDSQVLKINEVFGTDDIELIYKDFIKTIDTSTVFTNKMKNRVLYLKDTLKLSKNERIVAGVLMKGHNGPETAIDELIKGKVTTVSKVSSEQFHCLPYFFLLYIKKSDPKEIFFIAQSYKQFGFKEVFEEAFREFVHKKSPQNLTVQFNTLSVASLYEKYINEGRIQKLRFIKHQLSKNAESVLFGDTIDKKDKYEMELSIKSQKGFMGIKKAIKYEDASFIEQVQLDGFEFEEAFADVIVAGRKRVLNITKPKDFCAAYDITDDVTINAKTKLPDFKEVLEQTLDILQNDLIPNI